MIDFIDKIPGPDFLAYFAEFSAVCILLGRHLAGWGGGIGYPGAIFAIVEKGKSRQNCTP